MMLHVSASEHPSALDLYNEGFDARRPGLSGLAGPLHVLVVVVGLVVWIGLTVRAAATLENPSDPSPVLRTFAIGGALYIGGVIAMAIPRALRGRAPDLHLYRTLAVDPSATTAMHTRRSRWFVVVHLLLAATATGVVLWAISQGEHGPFGGDGPTTSQRVATMVFMGAWMLLSIVTVVMSAGSARRWYRGLGLAFRTRRLPYQFWQGRKYLNEAVGTRHGRTVVHVAGPRGAKLGLFGSFREDPLVGTHRLPDRPAVQGVTIRADATSIIVERPGAGAGRYLLRDLQLAEDIAHQLEHETFDAAR